MTFTLGFSPCPNDTFIFDGLVNKLIETNGIKFDVVLEDVQTLNELALAHQLDFTKISYGVLSKITDEYSLLSSGSALGSGVGPLLISKKTITAEQIDYCEIAIPGENTTAHTLFKMAFPNAKRKIFLRYDEIEDFLLEDTNEERAGVIIHENRFTYQLKGLLKIMDLGAYWESETDCAIPLGGIVAKKSIPKDTIKKVDDLIRLSIINSFNHYPVLSQFVQDNAREMNPEVMRKHIDLYVNDYTLELGEKGMEAITKFLKINDPDVNITQLFI